MDGVDAAVHLAAKIDAAESFKKPSLYDEVNVHGTLNLLNGCVKGVALTSSAVAIARQSGGVILGVFLAPGRR